MGIPAPAGDAAAGPHTTGVCVSRADRGELPLRRRGLAIREIAPADDRAVGPHPAVVFAPYADGDESPRRRFVLGIPINSPASDRAVGPHPAGVLVPGADGSESPAHVLVATVLYDAGHRYVWLFGRLRQSCCYCQGCCCCLRSCCIPVRGLIGCIAVASGQGQNKG